MAWKSCQNSALNEDIQTAKLFSKQNLTDSASLSKLNESESTRPNPLSPESIAIEDLVSALSESDLEILNWVSRVPTEQISNTLGTKFHIKIINQLNYYAYFDPLISAWEFFKQKHHWS